MYGLLDMKTVVYHVPPSCAMPGIQQQTKQLKIPAFRSGHSGWGDTCTYQVVGSAGKTNRRREEREDG